MKNYNKILEAINRGIKFALDDFNDNELIGQQTLTIKDQNITKDYLTLMDYVVDLGLPSGNLWCKYNMGCDYKTLNNIVKPKLLKVGKYLSTITSIEFDELTSASLWNGDYYAWGELEEKSSYYWNNYKFGDWNKLKKYRTNPLSSYDGGCDHLTKLELKDDVAYLNIHIGNYKFYIPTKKDFEELIKYTKHKWIENYNNIPLLNGLLFTSIINNNQIFFPAAGWKSYIINVPGKFGYYWTSNLSDEDGDECACYLNIYNWDVSLPQDGSRESGMPIRAICKLS